ncbi:MAG: glycoside hydrolase family 3 N-terminal domain-containing protein [Streptosporangiaceae bacterium]
MPAGLLAGLLAGAVAVSGCGGSQEGTASPSAPPSSHRITRAPASPPTTPSAAASCADRVLARMTLAQRVGQLFIVGLAGSVLDAATAQAIRAYHFGSVSFIATDTAGVAGVGAVTRAVQSLSSPQVTGGARFFVAANQEGGEVQALQGPGFSAMPSAVAQGMLPPAQLRGLARTWGDELRAAGVNLNFAPVMDVVPVADISQNAPIGELMREFGHTPAVVASHGVVFIQGMTAAGEATTAKHFPGLGRVRGNTDFSAGVVDTVTTPDDPYLRTFQAAIDAGVPLVMVALATYTRIDPRHLAVFSPVVMRTMLRERMHFGGVIVSDDLGAAQAVASVRPGSRAVQFIAAGGDLVTSKYVGPAVVMARTVLARAKASRGFGDEVDAAAAHVLTAKQRFGLLPC